jgi:histidinol phosphatase-like PHP family hydrolase
MNSGDILSRNHDIHMHSREFSDGSHPVLDVVCHASRWQHPPRWVGLSDHNPQQDEQIQLYISKLHDLQQELHRRDGITLLVGMELDWTPVAPTAASPALSELDYVLVAYHDMKFSTARQVEMYFKYIALHTYSDVVAHPDRFLGSVDTLSINWEDVFNNFKSNEIVCEYNLTTPLRPEIMTIAMHRTNVNFVIGSDTHDFRSIAVRRIIDAWSESLGGGYEVAREYLLSLLKMDSTSWQIRPLSRLFDNVPALDVLQRRLYLQSCILKQNNLPLVEEEKKLIQILAHIPECALDMDFLIQRLDRFSTLPIERISSLLSVEEFRSTIRKGRQKRKGE